MAKHQAGLDRDLTLLSATRRRYTLYDLLSKSHTNVDNLSRYVAALERGEPVDSVSESDRDEVARSLYHNHLPRLASHDLLEFDPRNGDVARAEGFEDLRTLIEQVRETDERFRERSEATESPADSESIASRSERARNNP